MGFFMDFRRLVVFHQPLWKIWTYSKWVYHGLSSPIFGVKIKKQWNHHLVTWLFVGLRGPIWGRWKVWPKRRKFLWSEGWWAPMVNFPKGSSSEDSKNQLVAQELGTGYHYKYIYIYKYEMILNFCALEGCAHHGKMRQVKICAHINAFKMGSLFPSLVLQCLSGPLNAGTLGIQTKHDVFFDVKQGGKCGRMLFFGPSWSIRIILSRGSARIITIGCWIRVSYNKSRPVWDCQTIDHMGNNFLS